MKSAAFGKGGHAFQVMNPRHRRARPDLFARGQLRALGHAAQANHDMLRVHGLAAIEGRAAFGAEYLSAPLAALRGLIQQVLRFGVMAVALGAAAGAQAQAPASDYPGSKPVRMIVPFPPGGGTDILSRIIAQKLTEHNHWTVVADNRAGAGGTIGITEATKAQPTGYDIVMGQKDNVVRQFLDQAKKQIQRANTDSERREAWGFLGDIEAQLKH